MGLGLTHEKNVYRIGPIIDLTVTKLLDLYINSNNSAY